MTSIKDYVKLYRDLGLAIVPLVYREKIPPKDFNLKEFFSRKPTDEEIDKWFTKEEMNLAVICGEPSDKLVVIDFDDPEVYPKFFDPKKIEASTIVVKTARGVQVYLRSKETVRAAKIPELHMEIRSNGNYVAAPPSIHPKGAQYAFMNPDVKTIAVFDGLEQSLWNRVEQLGVRKRVFIDPTWRSGHVGNYKGATPPCIEGLINGTTLGGRHDAAIRLFAYFLNFRAEKPKAVFEKLKKWNQKNNPPTDEAELQSIFEDVAKGPYNYGCTDAVLRCYCKQAECEVGKNKVSAEAIQQAQELTKDPEAFLTFLQNTLEPHLTGEMKNRLFLFLIGCGASVKTSLIRICGPNSVGKNRLCSWLQDVFGSDRVIPLSSASAPYLKRKVMQGLDTRGKIFILLEERGEAQGALKYQFEQIYSEDKIIIGMNVRNQESGEWEPVEVTLQGPLCFITTSTDIEISLHASTRQWEIYPDDSPKQTMQIDNWADWRELVGSEQLEAERKQTEVLKAYIGLLQVHKSYRVPFIRRINFKAQEVQDRRRKMDFIGLMRYAAHIFQFLLPIDAKTDTVFAMPFIFDFVMMIADDIIYTARGGLNDSENKILRFIEVHPETYTLNAEGKPVRTLADGSKEAPQAFKRRSIAEHPDFEVETAKMNERTLERALSGLTNKYRLGLLYRGSKKGGGAANVYGRLLTHSGPSKDLSKQSLLPQMSEISDDYLSATVRHILCVKSSDPNPVQEALSSVIGTVAVSHYRIRQESALFQPPWSGYDDPTLAVSATRLRRFLRTWKKRVRTHA